MVMVSSEQLIDFSGFRKCFLCSTATAATAKLSLWLPHNLQRHRHSGPTREEVRKTEVYVSCSDQHLVAVLGCVDAGVALHFHLIFIFIFRLRCPHLYEEVHSYSVQV